MARRDLAGSRFVITGATSGIGAALAAALAAAKVRLLLTGRRADRLEATRQRLAEFGADVAWVAGDVTRLEHRQELVDRVRERFGTLDGLVNNAGLGAWGPFVEADERRLREVFEVNFFAPAELTRQLFPVLRQGTRPILVNIGSVLGHRATPLKSEYCASKFALHGWSDALRAEWRAAGIDVLHVCPSTTRTEFFDQVLVADAVERPAPLRRSRGVMTPEQVAQRVVRAIRQGRHELILSAGGKLLVWLDRCWPWLADQLVARFGGAT